MWKQILTYPYISLQLLSMSVYFSHITKRFTNGFGWNLMSAEPLRSHKWWTLRWSRFWISNMIIPHKELERFSFFHTILMVLSLTSSFVSKTNDFLTRCIFMKNSLYIDYTSASKYLNFGRHPNRIRIGFNHWSNTKTTGQIFMKLIMFVGPGPRRERSSFLRDPELIWILMNIKHECSSQTKLPYGL